MNDHVTRQSRSLVPPHAGPEEAIRLAIEKAAQTVHNLRWFKVTEMRGNKSIRARLSIGK